MLTNVTNENRTKHLPNMTLDRNRYATLLGIASYYYVDEQINKHNNSAVARRFIEPTCFAHPSNSLRYEALKCSSYEEEITSEVGF
jgi:hypothetical protein